MRGSTLRNRPPAYKIALTQDFQAKNMNLLENGRLQPVIDTVFDWTEAEKAHQRMEENLKGTANFLVATCANSWTTW